MKFNDNRSGCSRVVMTDRRTDIPKITVAFRNIPKAPKHGYD